MHRVRVYVDGFNLYYGIHSAYSRQYLWLDLEALGNSLLRPGQQLDRICYFTARVRGLTDGRHRQDTYLQALAARATCLQIVEGRFQQKTQRCRSCGTSRITYEEKETDVSVAVTLVEDAARSAAPIVAVFPPRRGSDPLRTTADAGYRLGRAKPPPGPPPRKVGQPGRDVAG